MLEPRAALGHPVVAAAAEEDDVDVVQHLVRRPRAFPAGEVRRGVRGGFEHHTEPERQGFLRERRAGCVSAACAGSTNSHTRCANRTIPIYRLGVTSRGSICTVAASVFALPAAPPRCATSPCWRVAAIQFLPPIAFPTHCY